MAFIHVRHRQLIQTQYVLLSVETERLLPQQEKYVMILEWEAAIQAVQDQMLDLPVPEGIYLILQFALKPVVMESKQHPRRVTIIIQLQETDVQQHVQLS